MDVRVGCSLRLIKADTSLFPFLFRDSEIVFGGEQLDSSLFTPYIVDQLGHVLAREFTNYPYLKGFVVVEQAVDMVEIAEKYLTRFNHFINYLWFAKDNSVNIGTLFTLHADGNRAFLKFRGAGYSTASGVYEETTISLKDLEIAASAYEKIALLQSPTPNRKVEFDENARVTITDSPFHYKNYNENNRLDRALSFLAMARSNSFLPLKISLYIAVLECLFTTDGTEVSHKVSERAALYLGGGYKMKQRNYDILKANYDIRSGFFHGQTINKKLVAREKLESRSAELDEILRQILSRIILLDSAVFLDDNELPLFFKRLLLG